jgi:hypothetical protein
MRFHLALQRLDLLVEGGDDRGQRPDHRGARRGDLGRLGQLRAAQRGADGGGTLGEGAAAAGPFERGADLGGGQPGRGRRAGGLGQQLKRIGGGQVRVRLQCGGEEIPQLVAQPVHLPGPFPGQRLMRPGHHLDRLRRRAVRSDQAQLMSIGADHVGQHMRIPGVAFGTRDRMPFPVPGRLQRIDRINRVSGRRQGGHPRPPVGLDANPYLGLLVVLAKMLAEHRMQPGHPGRTLGQPRPGQGPAAMVHQLHIVMTFSPVVSDQHQHRRLPSRTQPVTGSPGRTISDLMNQCSRPQAGTTSQQRSALPAHRRGHDLPTGLPERARAPKCSPVGGYQNPSLPQLPADPLTLIRPRPARPRRTSQAAPLILLVIRHAAWVARGRRILPSLSIVQLPAAASRALFERCLAIGLRRPRTRRPLAWRLAAARNDASDWHS